MNLLELGALGELIGGIAVILTLLYLAVQVRQNTISLKTSAYQQWVALHGQTLRVFRTKNSRTLCYRAVLTHETSVKTHIFDS